MILLYWGGYLWLVPRSVRPAFVIEKPERDLGELAVGQLVLTFPITNQSDQPRRIIGL